MCNIPVTANVSTIFKYTQKPLRAFICGGKQLPFPRTSKTSKDQILSSVFYPGFIRLQNKHDDWWYGKNSVKSYIIICVKDRKKCCIFNGHFLKINSHPDICWTSYFYIICSQYYTYGVKIHYQLTTFSVTKQKLVAIHDFGDIFMTEKMYSCEMM